MVCDSLRIRINGSFLGTPLWQLVSGGYVIHISAQRRQLMAKVKQYLIYAIGLIVGLFCGRLVANIASDVLGLSGASFYSYELMIPTNLAGGIELLVSIVVFIATVELVERLGILK
jgi:hypothetical protein